ncbi:MAG TPA: hypothetical protein VLB27_06805, partial [candidate division Zixibacteria bacterium]|nr:hypothetical protein [candidate division Zixibacteria bacterium]
STNCGLPNCDTTGIGDTITNDTVFIYNPPTDITFPTFPDSRTLEDDILRIYLPFDGNGNPYPKIWDLWTPNDAFNLVRTVPQAVRDALSGHVLVMSSTQAKFNHYTQDSLFVADLKSQGIQAEFRSYDGYDGFADVLGERYLYDILPTILKFHSDRFHDNLPADLKIPDSIYQAGY